MEKPGYLRHTEATSWRRVGLVADLPLLVRRDRATRTMKTIPVATAADGDLIIVLSDDGDVRFVTGPWCQHPGQSRRLEDELRVGDGGATLICAHKAHEWSRADGSYVGSSECPSMPTFAFRVDDGVLSVLAPVAAETTVSIGKAS